MSIKKGSKIIAGAPLEPVWGTISGDITDQEDLQQALAQKANAESPAFTGTPTSPTPPVGSDNDRIATTSYVQRAIESVDGLPSQAGHSGQYLTTNGLTASWGTVDALPSQSGQSGKFLTTNGSIATWATVDALPSQSGQSGKFLTTNGSAASWADIPKITDTYSPTSSDGMSGKAVASAIEPKLNYEDVGIIVPDTTNMKVLETHEFDVSATTAYTFATFANNKTALYDLKGDAIFRITVTGTNIKQLIEGIISIRQAISNPFLVIRNRPGTAAAATTGIRYIYTRYPRELNNGYNYLFDLAVYDTTARHIKIEILKSDEGFTWLNSLSASSYDSTYQSSATLTAYTTSGIVGIPALNWATSSASTAGYITSYLPKLIGGTQPLAGAALLANQLCFMNGNKVYPSSNTTLAIEPGYGITINSTATNSGAATSYNYLRQKVSCTSLTNIPHATLARGNPCYFRCTMDSSGNIKSDNYVATSMAAGYTWYYIGVAQSSTAINIDTSQSFFLTLDSNGSLTHINGKKITSPDLANYATLASPTFTGTPAAPTANAGTSTTQIATTEFVSTAIGNYDPFPSQTGNDGKFLKTNGTITSWETITIPEVDQTYSGTSTNAQSGTAVKEAVDAAISSVYKPAGTVAFANLPSLGSSYEGYVYNVSDDFTTTADFVEGAGHSYPAGTNVVCINTATSGTAVYKWDVLAGFVDLSGYVKKDGGSAQQTISLTSGTGTTALGVKSMASGSYISFSGSNGWLASYGVTSEKKPTFYNGSSYTLAYVENTVASNAAITGATKCKITYDSKGLVTAGADLAASDIPSITLSKISDVTATASEVNVLDGITASTAELNYVDGVTSNIQTQLNNKAADNAVVHLAGDETITGTKSFESTLQLKNNLSFRSYGTNDSGRLQFGAQPSDNVIRGTVAITDGYSTSGSGYTGFVAQMVAREGSTTSEPFNTMRVSNKGIEYIKEANDGTITGQYILIGTDGIVPQARLASGGTNGQVLMTNGTTASWADVIADSEVEWATYGTTTYQQIKNWSDAGKIVFCTYTSVIYRLVSIASGLYCEFTSLFNNGIQTRTLRVDTSNIWSYNNIVLQSQIPAGTNGNIITYSGTAGTVGSATINDIVPTQSGNSGKFLTTNGSAVSWATVDALPSQSGQSGKFLTTNGTTASWAEVAGSGTTITYWTDD